MPRIRPRRPRVTNPPEVIPLVVLGFVAVVVANGLPPVLGWKFVRRLTAGWFRRQPPAPVG